MVKFGKDTVPRLLPAACAVPDAGPALSPAVLTLLPDAESKGSPPAPTPSPTAKLP
jgi:hypothetical protein